MRAAVSICRGSAAMKRETRMPAPQSFATTGASKLCWATTSSPPSVVTSCRRSGTRQAACGIVLSATAAISGVAAISRLRGRVISALRRAMSSSRMWRRSSRRCAVMPSAPASIAILAAATGSGWMPPRAFRSVATWSMFTPRRSSGIDPLGLRHHLLGAQLGDDRVEVLEVIDLEIDRHRGEVGRLALHMDIVDVAVVLGDDLCDLGERALLVHGLQRNAGGKPLRRRFVDVPAQVEPAFRGVLEFLQRRRLDRIDGDTLAGLEDADDAVTRHRPADRRETHRQVGVDAADRDSTVRLELDRL